MALTRQDLQVIVALVAQMINERPAPIGIAAHVVPGSYHAHDGTVEVAIDDSDAAYQLANALGDPDVTQFLSHPRVPIANSDPNDQYGARGGESVMLIPWQGGYAAKFIADADSEEAPGAGPFFSVKAPSGERWLMHRNADGAIDSSMLLTNDGPTGGDGLGGTIVGGDGALTQAQTASGHKVALNDTQQQINIKTAGGVGGANPLSEVFSDANQTILRSVSAAIFDKLDLANQKITSQVAANIASVLDAVAQHAKISASANVYTLVDGAGNAISHVVPGGAGGVVALGDLASNLTAAGKAAINNDILTTFGNKINDFGLANLIQYATLLNSVGAITGGQLSAMLSQLVLSWVTKVVVPAGSTIVKIAS